MKQPPHLLLVGGGHATVALLKRASSWTKPRKAHVTLLSDHPTLYYSGMVPEYIGGVYKTQAVQIDLQRWCRRAGITWRHGRASRLEPEKRVVVTEAGRSFSYDLVVFDIGARNTGAPATGLPTKPLHRIERLQQFVKASLQSKAERSLVIAGGGAAGVEIAFNLSARIHRAASSKALRLAIVESSSRLLPGFPTGMSTYATRLLRRRGVDIHLGATVKATDDDAALLNRGDRLPCDEVLWATGSAGPAIFPQSGVPCTERGFIRVRRSLQGRTTPRLFAAGDCAVIDGYEQLARVGVHAVKQGPLLAQNIERALKALHNRQSLDGTSFAPFKPYLAAPLILSTGQREGLWTAGPLWLRGSWALRLKHFIDLRWINQYQLPPSSAWTLPEMIHARSAYSDRSRTLLH